MGVSRHRSGLWVTGRDELPEHPVTGLRALGLRRDGSPIWPVGGMADQYWATPLPPFHPAIGASFGTFTTLQDVSPTPRPMIFGGQLRIQSKIHCVASGYFSTTATPTLQLTFYYGTTAVALAASGAITTGTATLWPWIMEYWGTVVAVGATGSIVGQGYLKLGTSLTAFADSAIPVTDAARTVAIDTTINKEIGVGAAYSASSASNLVRVNDLRALNWN